MLSFRFSKTFFLFFFRPVLRLSRSQQLLYKSRLSPRKMVSGACAVSTQRLNIRTVLKSSANRQLPESQPTLLRTFSAPSVYRGRRLFGRRWQHRKLDVVCCRLHAGQVWKPRRCSDYLPNNILGARPEQMYFGYASFTLPDTKRYGFFLLLPLWYLRIRCL